ncbi:MAG: DUF4974 domain-containing protein [Marinilabiliales bacterium]|nr:DUF4974 domain-containing protein [Marinilabiliales bacterium]
MTKKDGKEESALVFPGDIATVSRISINNAKNGNENIVAWKTKQIVFKEESLKNVIITLNKVYNTNIACNDQSILDLRIYNNL